MQIHISIIIISPFITSYPLTEDDQQRRLNSIAVLITLGYGEDRAVGDLWVMKFYQSSYLGMRKEVKINSDALKVLIYSNATRASNVAAGGVNEPGILALAEVEVFGMLV